MTALNIIITTADNTPGLAALLACLRAQRGLRKGFFRVIIADDSKSSRSKALNRCAAAAMENTLYTDHRTLAALAKTAGRPLPAHVALSTAANNVGTARNMGLTVSTAPHLLFLDDDIRLEKDFLCRLRRQRNAWSAGFSGFRLCGEPDISALERFQGLLLTGPGTKEKHVPNRYIAGLKAEFPSEFTDFFKLAGSFSGNWTGLPPRQHFSGACLLARRDCFVDDFFPHWYNEDWSWQVFAGKTFRPLQTELRFFHSRARARSASRRLLRWQETGEVIQRYLETGAEAPGREQPKLLQAAKQAKLEEIRGCLSAAKDLGKAPLGRVAVLAASLENHVAGISIRDIRTQLREYAATRSFWKAAAGRLRW